MKVAKLFLIGAIALGLGLTACNDETENFEGKPEATVSVKIMQDANPGTRVVGDLSGTGAVNPAGLAAESAIKKMQVWIFTGSTLDGYGESTTAEVIDIPVHIGNREIFIVVNGPAGLVKTTSKADLTAATQSLPVSDIATTGLTMTADALEVTIVEGKNTIGYGASPAGATSLINDPVKVSRINARVAIAGAVLNLSAEVQAIFNGLTDVQVAMFNVQKTANIFDPSTTSGNWMYGAAWPSPNSLYESGTVETALIEGTITFPITKAAAPYFYVNPMATANKMFIVLRGKPTLNGTPVTAEGLYTDGAGYTYYPVWINQTKDGTTFTTENEGVAGGGIVRRNTQYNIYLTIKNIGNPYIDPLVTAQLDVQVQVADWQVVNQNVNWGE